MSEKAKYVYTDDENKITRIKNALKMKEEKYGKGYCPCVPPSAHNDDTICPCKEYRENGGCCHCGLYKE